MNIYLNLCALLDRFIEMKEQYDHDELSDLKTEFSFFSSWCENKEHSRIKKKNQLNMRSSVFPPLIGRAQCLWIAFTIYLFIHFSSKKKNIFWFSGNSVCACVCLLFYLVNFGASSRQQTSVVIASIKRNLDLMNNTENNNNNKRTYTHLRREEKTSSKKVNSLKAH